MYIWSKLVYCLLFIDTVISTVLAYNIFSTIHTSCCKHLVKRKLLMVWNLVFKPLFKRPQKRELNYWRKLSGVKRRSFFMKLLSRKISCSAFIVVIFTQCREVFCCYFYLYIFKIHWHIYIIIFLLLILFS